MRRIVHSLIVWYLSKRGNAFHHGEYSERSGRYVALLTEAQYHSLNWLLCSQEDYDKQKREHINETLLLQGKCTDHIWLMEDGDDPYIIGIRMDCGDSGTVYLTRNQAKDLSEQLAEFSVSRRESA